MALCDKRRRASFLAGAGSEYGRVWFWSNWVPAEGRGHDVDLRKKSAFSSVTNSFSSSLLRLRQSLLLSLPLN